MNEPATSSTGLARRAVADPRDRHDSWIPITCTAANDASLLRSNGRASLGGRSESSYGGSRSSRLQLVGKLLPTTLFLVGAVVPWLITLHKDNPFLDRVARRARRGPFWVIGASHESFDRTPSTELGSNRCYRRRLGIVRPDPC